MNGLHVRLMIMDKDILLKNLINGFALDCIKEYDEFCKNKDEEVFKISMKHKLNIFEDKIKCLYIENYIPPIK